MSIDLAFTPSGHLFTIGSTDEERGLSENATDAMAGRRGGGIYAFFTGIRVLSQFEFEGRIEPETDIPGTETSSCLVPKH